MRGVSLLEMLVVLALLSLFVVMATANLSATQRRLDFDEFAREIVNSLEVCRWKALNERRYTGILVQQLVPLLDRKCLTWLEAVDQSDSDQHSASREQSSEAQRFQPHPPELADIADLNDS